MTYPGTTVEGRLAESGTLVRIRLEGDRIAAVEDVGASADLVAAGACWIAAGLVDIQVNGFAGFDFNEEQVEVEDVRGLVAAEWRRGVTALCPTLVSAPEGRITRTLSVIARARAEDPLIRHAVPCVHVEGPYLSAEDGPRGAHDREALRLPDVAELERWQQASDGLVGIVTLAPELAGALAYIRAAAAAGVVAAIGHTAAGSEEIGAAVDAGARLSTHLGNGCHLLLRRHPNHLWSQLAEDRLMAGFIADGHHLPTEVVTSMVRAKGLERSILVSDSVALAGSPEGEYRTPVGERVTLGAGGRLSIAGTDLLAGSASCLPDCIAWLTRRTEVSLAAATRMASENPCRLLGLAGRGQVRVGGSGDLTIFELDPHTGAFQVDATLVAGQVVFRGSGRSLAGC